VKSKNIAILVLSALVLILIIFNILFLNKIFNNKEPKQQQVQLQTGETYNPQINPNDFVSKIDNKYLTFSPGTNYIYAGESEDGTERIEVYVTDNIKRIMGVEVLEVRDRVWLEGELIEDTRDWYAQDKQGNVWYFGEDSKELINGKVVGTEGSWVAGVYGAKPGIVMKANPQVGEIYRQEYYKGQAEDMGEIVALGVKVKVKYGSFSNCLQTKDWNPLEPGNEEYKYYCPEVGNVVYEVGIESGESVQLIDIKKESDLKQPAKQMERPLEELKKDITEQEAVAIAKKAVSGNVGDVEIERNFGKATYVVEVGENDVIIDIETGEILDIES
jgi:hypothetical protein